MSNNKTENNNTATMPAQTNGKAINSGEPEVSQIRELIFGQQMIGYEERFAKLEQSLTHEVNTMKASLEQGLSELREFMKTRSDSIESASVPRKQIAETLEQMAKTLRES